MECPECGEPLEYEDYFGPYQGGGIIEKVGTVWGCRNEECDSHWFHMFEGDTEPREGYPC